MHLKYFTASCLAVFSGSSTGTHGLLETSWFATTGAVFTEEELGETQKMSSGRYLL